MNIKLSKNLRRQILRGHPWIYSHAIKPVSGCESPRLCRVSDNKGDLAWALYDPHCPLALRILSLERSAPNFDTYAQRLAQAYNWRKSFLPKNTDAYRLINGEGDLLPGLVCDVYGKVAVLQFDGPGPREFWDQKALAAWLLEHSDFESVVEKSRGGADRGMQQLAGQPAPDEVQIQENGLRFKVQLAKGQKTGFFLDQRDNRHYLTAFARGKRVLNLFSYTGGFSVSAGQGEAAQVVSVDSAPAAIDLANSNWALNGLDSSQHQGHCADVFDFLGETHPNWDVIIVDPPSMAHSEKQKPKAIEAYTRLFATAAGTLAPGGHLLLSSCSSHISFDDFFDIITQALSKSRRKGRYLRISGQAPDHPFPHACPELRYLKFTHLMLD